MQTPAVAKPDSGSTRHRVLDAVLLAALWIVAASVLAELTTRALDWFAKDDELRYERLAISIARTHSLVPRIHGVNIESYSQLYPLLIAPFFRHGLVPQNVQMVHLANAWIMSSACIPAFFLARQVTGRRWAAYLAAGLTVVMPWIILSTMMMTEVASYPAFVLALLAIQRATVSPSRRNDLLALASIALAYFARGELLVLIFVFPLAVIAYELRSGERSARRLVKRHDLVAVVCLVVLVTAATLRLTGALSRVAGVYGRYAKHEQLLPHGVAGSFVEHLATFSLAFGVLPFVGGVAWLLANAASRRGSNNQHAFAWIGSITVAAVMYQSTNFDVLYNAFVHDRFLLYLVPIVVISVLCATVDAAPLRWSLVLPATLVALGFAVGEISFSTWGQFATIDDDAVIGAVYKPLVQAFGSLTGARTTLVVFTLLGSALLLLGGILLPRLRIAAVLSVMLVFALPATTAYAFARFFDTNDWASRPITNPQGRQDRRQKRRSDDRDVSRLVQLVRQLPRLPRLPVLERVDRPKRRTAARRLHLQQLLVPQGLLAVRPHNRPRRRLTHAVCARGRSGIALQGLREGDRELEHGRTQADPGRPAVADRLALLRSVRRRLDTPRRDRARARIRHAKSAWIRPARDHVRRPCSRRRGIASLRGVVEPGCRQRRGIRRHGVRGNPRLRPRRRLCRSTPTGS